MQHVLVANRGEIAVRVLRAASAVGYRTTAVFGEADAGALHTQVADHAVRIGPAPVRESYLDIERVLAAARATGADAVHPGYGLLAENADFAAACVAAGLTFIGPRPETIALMADKRAARRAAAEAGLPCVPGYDGDDQAMETLVEQAGEIGFPLMVKAALGGGGRGMRRVAQPADLEAALERARTEAQAAFGDGRLLLELAVEGGRHVEVQLVGDVHGHVVQLGERDCSVQRRFQKLIEESPSPAVDRALREQLGEAAVRLGRACHYLGVGTVEFLLGPDGRFFFLEMNTRLQVEHPVTECVTGFDLVQLQFAVAEGQSLPFSQEDVTPRGHAIEARLCAEDPAQEFLPQTGRVVAFRPPKATLARTDHGIRQGTAVTSHYDSMVAKVIAQGPDRASALRRLERALQELVLFGVEHNRDYLRAVLSHPVFVAGGATTAFVAEHGEALCAPVEPSRAAWASAAFLFGELAGRAAGHADGLRGFSNSAQTTALSSLGCAGTRCELAVVGVRWPRHWLVMWGDEVVRLEEPRVALAARPGRLDILCDGTPYSFAFERDRDASLYLQGDTGCHRFDDLTHSRPEAAQRGGSGRVSSSIEAAVVQLEAGVGDRVQRGDPLVVLEAMKLQHLIEADIEGLVEAIHVGVGDQVAIGQLLVEISPGPESTA